MLAKILRQNKTALIISYKLLHDTLLLMLVFFILTLLAEGVLPGIISSRFGMYKIALLTLGNILAIAGIKKFIGNYKENIVSKKIIAALLFISALLLFNSLLKLNIFLNLFILFFIFAIIYFLFKLFQEK